MYRVVYFRIYAFELRNICVTIQMHITPHTHTHTHRHTTHLYLYTCIHIYSCKCIEFIFLNVNKCAYVFWIDSVRYFRVGYETIRNENQKTQRIKNKN